MAQANECPFFTTKETAEYLGTCTKTVYELVNTKAFPSIKIGRHHKVLKNHLDAWISSEFKRKQRGL